MDEQRSTFEAGSHHPVDHAQAAAEPTEKAVETHGVGTAETISQSKWENVTQPSARLAARIQEFEASVNHPDPERRGFRLADEQRAACKWFGAALGVAFDEEIKRGARH